MVRPRKNRIVAFNPDISYFKPRGIPMLDLEEVHLTVDERESIRLADLLDMSHEEAGRNMGVSRATFGRIVQRARKSIADAMINGKAINIEGGKYKITNTVKAKIKTKERTFICPECNHKWEVTRNTKESKNCPLCNNKNLHHIREQDISRKD